MAERNYVYDWDAENAVLTKTFKDGRKVVIDTKDFPQEAKDFIFQYGLRQACSDRHSGEKDLDKIVEASMQWAQDMEQGIFRRRREGGLATLVVKAYAEYAGVSEEEAQETLAAFLPQDGDDEETLKAKKAKLTKIRNSAELVDIADRISGKKKKGLASLLTPETEEETFEEA